jgi:hypothetical protein
MQMMARTTAICHCLPSNRAARTRPYPFGHLGLAGEPAGLDPAQIWLGPARSGLPFFFLCSIYLLNCVLHLKSV